jgi:hypothetical protein
MCKVIETRAQKDAWLSIDYDFFSKKGQKDFDISVAIWFMKKFGNLDTLIRIIAREEDANMP